MSSGLSRVESQKKRRLKEKKPYIRRALRVDQDTENAERIIIPGKNMSLRRSDKKENETDSGNEPVPSRTDTYSTRNVKISKIFLNTLITLFIILTGVLVWWGLIGAPPLKEIW